MLSTTTVVAIALAYMGLLFAVASYGDRCANRMASSRLRPVIYSLSLAVYCTAWIYYGSVGMSARSGYDFLPLYIGPFIVLLAGWPVLRIIVDVSNRQNITSIADLVSARYGKNQTLGAIVALIAVVGLVPFIALQLKAVALSLQTMLPQLAAPGDPASYTNVANNVALVVAAALAGFTILFGTRRIDTTEHQHGLIQATAVQSVVTIVAFVAVGSFVTFEVLGGIGPALDVLTERKDIADVFFSASAGDRWIAMTVLTTFAVLLLPRQFHVAVVENTNPTDIRRAAFLFPLYLFIIVLFVAPIAVAGLNTFDPASTDPDTFVLALPLNEGQVGLALLTFLGGLSAATAMVIIETLALSIMVCNNIVLPVLLRRTRFDIDLRGDLGKTLLLIRRIAIVAILTMAYSYYRMIGTSAALSETGLLSIAAVAQFAPAVFGGMMWRLGTARAAMAGLIGGFLVWIYTMLLPSFADAGLISQSFVDHGPFELGALRPRLLFNLAFDPLAHGVFWSLFVNIALYVGISLASTLSPIERLQAAAFMSADTPASTVNFRLWRNTITVAQLQGAVARYLGEERTRRSFDEYATQHEFQLEPNAEADDRLFRFAEHLLSSVVGAASSRLVLSLVLERHSDNKRGTLKLLDDASAAIQYNRDLLQSAIDHVREGIGVFDGNLSLVCWNRQFRGLLRLPEDMGRVGVPLDEVLRALLRKAGADAFDLEKMVAERLQLLTNEFRPFQERFSGGSTVLEVRSSQMPDGGIVITFTDISERVLAAEALERRVEERTAKLTELNKALSAAKADAEAANLGKTRFIAAASHDILQPLNAARLFTSSLVERKSRTEDQQLVENVDASLEAVEEILTALLDISRLDAGAMRPEITDFAADEILNALSLEYGPSANARGLDLTVVPCTAVVKSDRRLLRRVLQNLLSNAIKYTDEGRVLMGCRRKGQYVVFQVHDTGAGIPEDKRGAIFKEFERLNPPGNTEAGLGLGLSIVQRIADVLGCELTVESAPGLGSMFALKVPLGARSADKRRSVRAALRQSRPIAGHTVLVVDNEQPILEGMRTLLTGWQCNVITADNAEEAHRLASASKVAIDIVLADFHLEAQIDGLKLISKLREVIGPDLPAVLITADRTREIQERAAGLNVVYMRKPVKPAALRASIGRAMIARQAAE